MESRNCILISRREHDAPDRRPLRADQWGVTNPQTARLARIQQLFRFTEDGFRT
jgi:hypothetical protein